MKQAELIRMTIAQSDRDWVPSYHIQSTETPWGFIGTSGDRIARKMVADGELERKRRGKYAYYKIKEESKQDKLI